MPLWNAQEQFYLFMHETHYTTFSFNRNGTYCVRREPASKMMTNHHRMLTFCDVLHAPLLLLALLGTRQHSRIPPKSNNINSYLHEPSWSGPNLWKCFMKKDKTWQDNLMPKLCYSCTTITIQTAIKVRLSLLECDAESLGKYFLPHQTIIVPSCSGSSSSSRTSMLENACYICVGGERIECGWQWPAVGTDFV